MNFDLAEPDLSMCLHQDAPCPTCRRPLRMTSMLGPGFRFQGEGKLREASAYRCEAGHEWLERLRYRTPWYIERVDLERPDRPSGEAAAANQGELAAEREKRLEAELAAERLREALRDLVAACEFGPGESPDDAAVAHERALAALSAPPPSLDPLRELVRAAGSLRGLTPARDAVLAAYPFLREAEGGGGAVSPAERIRTSPTAIEAAVLEALSAGEWLPSDEIDRRMATRSETWRRRRPGSVQVLARLMKAGMVERRAGQADDYPGRQYRHEFHLIGSEAPPPPTDAELFDRALERLAYDFRDHAAGLLRDAYGDAGRRWKAEAYREAADKVLEARMRARLPVGGGERVEVER